MKNLKIVGITETTILNEEGKVVFDAGALEHTALEDHEQAKKITKLFAASLELLAACQSYMQLFRESDMRPEDECHELANVFIQAIKKATE